MRIFSDTVKAILASGCVSPFYLVETKIPASNVAGLTVDNSVVEGSFVKVRETDTNVDLTVSGLGTFFCDSGLTIVQGPRQSASVDRETYNIAYLDPDMRKRALFEAGLAGSSITTYIGFYNTLAYAVNGYAPGMPILSLSDILIAYRGIVDSHGYTLDPQEESIAIAVECASPMASLSLSRPFYTSKESMRQLNQTDTAFDQVSISQSKTVYLWGKK